MGMPDSVPARRVTSYRRRKPLPAIILMAILGLVAAIVWFRTLDTAEQHTDAACTPPHAALNEPPPPQEVLARNALDEVDPLPPDAVKVTVLNANGQRGQAGLVARVLTVDLGFGKAAEPTNDVRYPDSDLDCHAQIRFGPDGLAAGRTLSLVVPCAELVRDTRKDNTVDLALGRQFDTLHLSPDAKEILQRLTELAAQPANPTGGQQGLKTTVDPALLASARDAVRC